MRPHSGQRHVRLEHIKIKNNTEHIDLLRDFHCWTKNFRFTAYERSLRKTLRRKNQAKELTISTSNINYIFFNIEATFAKYKI